MNNEEIKKSAARAVPVSTLSTYVAAPAAPAYATAAPAAAVASARMPAAIAPAASTCVPAAAPACASAAPAAAVASARMPAAIAPAASTCVPAAAPACASAAPADALSAAPALAAIPGDDLAPDGAITAILPIYDDNGRGIVIYTADGGRRVTGRRMRSILQRLAERNCRTIPLIRRRMKDLLGGRQELPLPISPQLILVPCKVVTPRVKGDETIGYFSLAHIRALHTLPHRSRGHAAAAARSGRKAPGDRAAAPVAARHAAVPAAARRAADPPVYELSDGRRVALLCTSDTARHRLEMAAYARCLMFGA